VSERARTLAVLVAAVAVGLAYRLLLFRGLLGRLRGDHAVVALMAKHITEGHHYVFYWGQDYMGSLEPYTVAALVRLFGLSDAVVMTGPLLWGLVHLLTFYLLGRLLYDRAVGAATVFAAALAPPLLALWHVEPRGGYAEGLALGQLALVIAIWLARDRPRDWGAGPALALGLVAGLGFWTNLLVVDYLVPAGVLLLSRDPGAPLRRHSWVALASFGLGSLPLWVHNVAHGFSTFAIVGGRGGYVSAARNALQLCSQEGPVVLGVARLNDFGGLIGGSAGIAAAAIMIAGIAWSTWRARRGLLDLVRPSRAAPGGEVCVLLLLTALFLYLPTRFATWNAPRYLLPAYGGILPLLAAAGVDLWRRSRLAAALATLFVAGVVGAGARAYLVALAVPDLYGDRLGRLLQLLSTEGVRQGFADYDEALLLTYRSNERSLMLEREMQRYPRDEIADWRPDAVLARRESAAALQAALTALDCAFERRDLSTYALFYRIRPRHQTAPIADRSAWMATASDAPENAHLAIDGDLGTRWGSARPQSPGVWFEVDLGRETEVGGVVLRSGRFGHDTPRAIRVETRAEDGVWSPAVTLDAPAAGLVLSNGAIDLRSEATIEVGFSPRAASAIRISLAAADRKWDWSIAELVVKEARPPPAR
jgi:4-amino-4-deoxy-L-arabinose transferase-like glycosyltransferase